MQIADGHAVFFHYVLKSDGGEVIDSSEGREPLGYLQGSGAIVPGLEKEMAGREPLGYLQGSGAIVPGLEKEMAGKKAGDVFDVTIAPADGYGEKVDELIQEVPREVFKDAPEELRPGLAFQVQTPNGVHVFTITDVADEQVTIDGNHALAGENLNFHIEVSEVREATESEVAHGHPHGDGGCCG